MKNKIIVYGVDKIHCAVWPNTVSLAEGFQSLGYEVLLCDCANQRSVLYCFDRLLNSNEIAFSVGSNDIGMHAQFEAGGESLPIYANIDTPHVSMLLDVPYNKCSSGPSIPARHHIVTLLDRDASTYLDLTQPKPGLHQMFLPLGGTEDTRSLDELLSTDRPYDVVFSASRWSDVHDLEPFWTGENWQNKAIIPLLDEVADCMRSFPVNTITAFRTVLEAHGLYEPEYMRRLTPYFWPVMSYIKLYRREKALQFLADNDIPVEVFGGNWEHAPFADKLHLHGPVSFAETLDAFGKAKIVYQDEAEFNNGGHDRVFTGMLHGAVIMSEYSRYLAEEFTENEEILFFDWQHGAEQVRQIPELLADEPRRQAIAERAYHKAYAGHRWINTARDIDTVVRILYPEAFL